MIDVAYVTSSPYKREEIALVQTNCRLSNGRLVNEVFSFTIREVSIKEHLEVDLATLVIAEAANAYGQLKLPCIVEHAGLIFDRHYARGYPGGLTKPMWDVLRDDFIAETASAGQTAFAKACIAYCDGKGISTFDGETRGRISDYPRGGRAFYWDTVFIPEDPSAPGRSLTYAEIVDDPSLGLPHKVSISQSTKAMMSFLEHRLIHEPDLWRT